MADLKHETRENRAELKPLPEDYIKARPASQFLYEGEKRILLEMESVEGMDVCRMLQAYGKLVDYVCKAIKKDPAFDAADPKSFLRACSTVLKNKLGFSYGTDQHGYLIESLRSMHFDCDNSAFLAFDVAARLGIQPQPRMVILPGHVLLKIGKCYFETLSGLELDDFAFSKKYKGSHWQISRDTSLIQSISVENRGLTYYTLGDFETALRDCSKAIELNPRRASCWDNRGTAYLAQGNFEAAIEDYSRAIELSPGFSTTYYNRGNALYNQGNFDAAIEDYSKAIEINPKDAGAFFNRGVVYYSQGNLEAAIDDYSTAIAIAPGNPEAYKNRGFSYHLQGQLKNAIQDYSKAAELDPQDERTAATLNMLVEQMKDGNSARASELSL